MVSVTPTGLVPKGALPPLAHAGAVAAVYMTLWSSGIGENQRAAATLLLEAGIDAGSQPAAL